MNEEIRAAVESLKATLANLNTLIALAEQSMREGDPLGSAEAYRMLNELRSRRDEITNALNQIGEKP